MALFQELQTQTSYEKTNRINQMYKDEFKSIYDRRLEETNARIENEQQYVKNLVSPEKIKEWQDKGNLSVLEVWNKKTKHELIPYMGTIAEGRKSFKLKEISDKLRKGQFVTPEERELFDNFVLDMAEIQTRGYSFMGGAVNIGLDTLPFMTEFGIGLLTSGGTASLGSASVKIGTKAAIKNIGKNIAKTLAEKSGIEIAGDIIKGTAKTAINASINPRTYAFTATRLPQQVYARMGDLRLSDSMYVTPEGQVILKEAQEKPASAFIKALCLTNIEVASEMSGEILVRPLMHGLGRLAAPKVVRNLVAKNLPEQFTKLVEKVTKMPFLRAVDSLGWNGVIEEVGEERIGDLLKFAFNLNDKEGYSFEQFLDAAFVSPKQLAQEAISFGLTGLGMNAARKGLEKNSKYSKDEFLCDAGIFRTENYESLLDKSVRTILKSQGKTGEDIENALNFGTYEDKIEFLKQNNINAPVQDLKNKYYTQIKNAGVEDSEALQSADLFSQIIATTANKFNMSIEDTDRLMGLNIKSMTDEQANAQWEKDNEKIKKQMFQQSIRNKNIVDLSNDFSKTPTIDEVKNYINELVESGRKFATLSPDWFVDVKGGSRTKKKILNKGNYKNIDRKAKIRHNKYIMSLEKLLSNAQYAGEKENTKKDKKPNVDKYHYFKTNVQIGNKIYQIIFDTEEYKNKNPQGADTINVTSKEHLEGNNSITNSKAKFNPKTVHLYNITEIKKPNIYFQESDNIENARGFTYQRQNFDGTAKDNLIVLLKGKANKSTLLHEFAHVYLTTLNNLARENERAKDMLIKVNKFLRYNGKEYTEAQHEKFANSFVAYVKTGKAPTYGLKRVFENFKKWLNDLYSNLQLSDDVELSKEAKEVFDELLGDMTLEAQKKASLEIIKKARNNALLRIHQDEENGKVPQYQLTERQRRYRDTAYDILWYALSNTKNSEGKYFVKDKRQLYMLLGNDNKIKNNNKGVISQSEKLAQILGELDDPFSSGDGFLPEWGEFFNDPGVSYDNAESGADSKLALAAYDVIKNKKYLYDAENVYEELSGKDVKVAELELDYILQRYSEENNDKTNVVVGFFEWIEQQHPYIREDLIKRWELKTNEIDRYQALSKFGQAKEDLKLYASKLQGYGDYSTQFAQYARAILKRLDFMIEKDKEKILSKLKEYNSFREIESNLDEIMDWAQTLQDVSDRRQIADDINREVKQTIHEWKGGIKKTKYTYPANKLFENLRKINNLNQEEILYLYDQQVNEEYAPSYIADEVNNEDFYETIEKMFITFKANGSYYNSTEFLTNLLNKIQSAKFSAKIARDEADFKRRMQQINLIDECARAVDKHKFKDKKNKMVKAAQDFNAHIMNLNGALEMIFNEKIKNKFSLDYLYAKKDGQVGKDRREVLDKLKEVFGFKHDMQLFSKFIDMTKAEYKIKQRYTPDIQNGTVHTSDIYDKESGQTKATVQQIRPEGEHHTEWEDEPIKLSKMEIIYYYIQAKNKTSYLMLTDMGDKNHPPKGQFNKFEFDTMIDSLTPQEKLMGDILQAAAEKYYDGLNAYHIKKYHTDLGRVSCYFPRLSEVEDPRMLDVFNDYVVYNAKDSSQKHRTAYAGIRIKPANAVAVLFNHIEKANTIITMGEQLDLMNRVFNNSNLKKKIEAVFGRNVTQSFYHHITANLYSGQVASRSLQEEFFNKLTNNVIKTQIFFKPQIGLKQLLSFMNYGKGDKYVSAGEWLKEFSKQTLTPSQWKKNIDFMLENDYLRDRYFRGGSTDALKRQLETRLFSKLSLLDEFWGMPIQLGDIGAIILGGKPYVDVLMKKGYTKEQAFKIFIETTVNDQQSSIPSTLSNAQRNAKNQPFAKMFFAYQNTPWQYLRSAYTPIVKMLQQGGRKNKIKAGKMLFIYGWLFPAIFNMASTLSIFTFMGGDDEQLKKDMTYAFMGLFGMFPVTGDLLNSLLHGLLSERASGGNYFETAKNRINKLARHIQKNKVTLEDVWGCIATIGEMSTGQPIGSMGNAVSGVYDMTQGDVAKGALKVLGYSDYRAKSVSRGDSARR